MLQLCSLKTHMLISQRRQTKPCRVRKVTMWWPAEHLDTQRGMEPVSSLRFRRDRTQVSPRTVYYFY
ncbi:Adapter molecule crk [Dissostichus eleginoides]|uniref:Adapter molecule crk n=1 Tax=Dissostichus eleginoides TaxID=100907 RepID=A0AAD9FN93_DISEL|nr:Adapter molecule crk [Dissostichus eleginoides]